MRAGAKRTREGQLVIVRKCRQVEYAADRRSGATTADS